MQNNPLLPETGYIRLPAILKLLPLGKSTWWAGVKDGRFIGTKAHLHNQAAHRRESEHQIEEVRQKLRDMMPWAGQGQLVDKDKN